MKMYDRRNREPGYAEKHPLKKETPPKEKKASLKKESPPHGLVLGGYLSRGFARGST